ncbi:MAG: glutamate formiminotransferase [Actinobacteria bacterium]|nr:glutamate formiminotransferase [Actinomycetota bacterium]
MLTCVVNVSEGRRPEVLAALGAAAGDDLLDLHADEDHHRSVLTLVGEEAVRAVSRVAVELVDLRTHTGVHPRMGVVDVVPFVALTDASMGDAEAARDRFTRWLGGELGVPAFRYGTGRASLPEIRRRAFVDLAPDAGPASPHPSAGASAVGARLPLVAYNLWLAEPDLARARSLACSLRSPAVRALGLAVGDAVQVSCNLVHPTTVGPAQVYDAVAAQADIARAELVGLAPAAVVTAVAPRRWGQLDVSPERTVEARLEGTRPGARRRDPPPTDP